LTSDEWGGAGVREREEGGERLRSERLFGERSLRRAAGDFWSVCGLAT
jgi:hypothetical protein